MNDKRVNELLETSKLKTVTELMNRHIHVPSYYQMNRTKNFGDGTGKYIPQIDTNVPSVSIRHPASYVGTQPTIDLQPKIIQPVQLHFHEWFNEAVSQKLQKTQLGMVTGHYWLVVTHTCTLITWCLLPPVVWCPVCLDSRAKVCPVYQNLYHEMQRIHSVSTTCVIEQTVVPKTRLTTKQEYLFGLASKTSETLV